MNFNTSTLLQRTPVKLQEENSNKTQSNEISHQKAKRKLDEVTNDDIYNLIVNLQSSIKEQNAEMKKQIDETKEHIGRQIEVTNEKIENMEMNVQDLGSKVNDFDIKLNGVTKVAERNEKLLNTLMQARLENLIEICGVNSSVINQCNDLKQLVISVIKSFGIPIKEEDIARVTKREINARDENSTASNKHILVVTFNNFSTKIEVMKQKSKCKDDRGIFFNISLTPSNRFLMMNARKLTKNKKLKVYFSGGKVRVKKRDGTEIIIEDAKQLGDLQQYVDSIEDIMHTDE